LSHEIFLGDFGILVSSKVDCLELIAFSPKAEGSTTVLRPFAPRVACGTHNRPEACIERWFRWRSKESPPLAIALWKSKRRELYSASMDSSTPDSDINSEYRGIRLLTGNLFCDLNAASLSHNLT
jgi:hypothetical protein